MKKCDICKKIKDILEFNKNRTKKDGYNSICKICSRERSKNYYKDNTDHHKKVVNKNKQKYRKNLYFKINTIKKEKGCYFCNENEPCCIDFHHINPKEKQDLISRLINSVAPRKLEKEIKKCIPVCSNCHRKLHNGLLKFKTLDKKQRKRNIKL